MSRIVPISRTDRLAFYRTRIPSWTSSATLIGTTAAAVTDLDAKLTAAEAARTAQELALAEAKAKTAMFYAAVDAASIAGAAIIKDIRGEGQRTGDPAVWEAAMIPAPDAPSPVAPPGQPRDFKVTLDISGGVTATWKCDNPGSGPGVFYNIFRRNSPTEQYQYLGTAGQRKFIDDSIPTGSSQITYKIQAARTTGPGPAQEFNVNFGISGTGSMTAMVTPVKVAA